MIPGRATREGTERYRERFAGEVAAGHFRRFGELWVSSIGLGTYLGEADDAADAGYEEAVLEALRLGCNVFDTAINYRHQRSERAVGRALARAFEEGLAARDEVLVCTKGGFLPFDGGLPEDPGGYLRSEYLESGLLAADDVAAGCHAMPPGFLRDQLGRSRANLGLETVDLYYLHNPETQLGERDRSEVMERIGRAFGELRRAASEGAIAGFGAATWNAFRSDASAGDHLDLEELAALAGGEAPAAVQLPLNLAMPEALLQPTQALGGATVPLTVAARHLGAAVFTSASILQGRLSRALPDQIGAAFPGLESDTQRALQFARSAPGVTTALVGMGRARHVRENLAVAGVAPAGPAAYESLFTPR